MTENRQLTGLRGIAALDVMISHYNFGGLGSLRWLEFNNAAVDLFFCLSGFTLCMVYKPESGRLNARSYTIARFARVYPLYLFSLLLAGILIASDSAGFRLYPAGHPLADGIRQLLMVNAWPLIGSAVHWDLPAWSVSVEMLCYILLFPAFFTLSRAATALSTNARLGLMIVLCFVSAVGMIIGFDAKVYAWSTPLHSVSTFPYWLAAIRAVLLFSSGWIAYMCYIARDAIAGLSVVATDALTLLVLLIDLAAILGLADRQFAIMVFPFLILGLTSDTSITARVLATRPVHFLGVLSYSIYLLHFPIWDGLKMLFPEVLSNGVLRAGVAIPVVLLTSVVTYYGIEAPMRRFLRTALGYRPRTLTTPRP